MVLLLLYGTTYNLWPFITVLFCAGKMTLPDFFNVVNDIFISVHSTLPYSQPMHRCIYTLWNLLIQNYSGVYFIFCSTIYEGRRTEDLEIRKSNVWQLPNVTWQKLPDQWRQHVIFCECCSSQMWYQNAGPHVRRSVAVDVSARKATGYADLRHHSLLLLINLIVINVTIIRNCSAHCCCS